MNIAEQLTLLNKIKNDIKEAIIAKGVEVLNSTPFKNYAEKISEISSSTSSPAKWIVRGHTWLTSPCVVEGQDDEGNVIAIRPFESIGTVVLKIDTLSGLNPNGGTIIGDANGNTTNGNNFDYLCISDNKWKWCYQVEGSNRQFIDGSALDNGKSYLIELTFDENGQVTVIDKDTNDVLIEPTDFTCFKLYMGIRDDNTQLQASLASINLAESYFNISAVSLGG